MLASLHIENIAVIKTLDIDFKQGFSTFTGETGAGKSIIINSINLLCGEKIQKDMIRAGEEKAVVSALFTGVDAYTKDIAESNGISCQDDEIFIIRNISTDGRSTIKINGRACPAYVLRLITQKLLAIHGQHSSYQLLNADNYLGYLDDFSNIDDELIKYRASYTAFKKERSILKALLAQAKDKNDRASILKTRIKEIDELKLKPGEEERLSDERLKIKNSEQLIKQVKIISKTLYSSSSSPPAIDLLHKACDALESISALLNDAKWAESAKRLSDFCYEAEDIALSARELVSDIEDKPSAALDSIEGKLEKITSLKKKFNTDVEGLLKLRNDTQQELEQLQNSDILIKESKEKLLLISEECKQTAAILSQKREQGAQKLAQQISSELAELDMKQLSFKISVNTKKEYSENGADEVDFLISTNAGEDEKSVDKVASGGELSRLMLAMQCVFRKKNGIDTVIYDEIDTGISGGTCEKIGRKLKNSANFGQVICITHSAQIAAVSDNHYKIYKQISDERTETKIKLLSNDERIKELSRIMGGITITQSVEAAAREMIENGKRK